MSVGSPACLLLDQWAAFVAETFGGHCCYLVGSAFGSKDFRDVDVVLMLPDDVFADLFGEEAHPAMHLNRRWSAMCTAFSLWAAGATGLNVDFKFQDTTLANERHKGPREPVGLFIEGREEQTP